MYNKHKTMMMTWSRLYNNHILINTYKQLSRLFFKQHLNSRTIKLILLNLSALTKLFLQTSLTIHKSHKIYPLQHRPTMFVTSITTNHFETHLNQSAHQERQTDRLTNNMISITPSQYRNYIYCYFVDKIMQVQFIQCNCPSVHLY